MKEDNTFAPLPITTFHRHNGFDAPKISASDLEGGGSTVCAKMYSGSAQAISNTTLTVVNFDTSSFAVGCTNNTTDKRIDILTSGYYNVQAQVTFNAAAASKDYYLYIYINTTAQNITYTQSSTTGPITATTNNILYLAAGDYIQVRVYHNQGASSNTRGGEDDTILTLFKL
jgi:hypothetical protein